MINTLRPGITNSALWYPARPPKAEWEKIRKVVMVRDNWTCFFCEHRALKWMNTHHIGDSADNNPKSLVPLCIACHAVMHIGFNLIHKVIEIWKCDMPQVEIVKYTRKGVKQGLSLAEVNAKLPISPGPYPPDNMQYANDLILKIGDAPRAYLDNPLCAIFINLERWQIE